MKYFIMQCVRPLFFLCMSSYEYSKIQNWQKHTFAVEYKNHLVLSAKLFMNRYYLGNRLFHFDSFNKNPDLIQFRMYNSF